MTAGPAPARALVGLAAAPVRLPLRQELQGEEAGGAADHAAAGRGAAQRAQLRSAGQAAQRDAQAARAGPRRRGHRHAAGARRPAAALGLQPLQRAALVPARSSARSAGWGPGPRTSVVHRSRSRLWEGYGLFLCEMTSTADRAVVFVTLTVL